MENRKSLEEVIDKLESVYYNDQKKVRKDAIYYLKEYNEIQDNLVQTLKKAYEIEAVYESKLESLKGSFPAMKKIEEFCCNTCDSYERDGACYCKLWSRQFPSDHFCKSWEARE